MSNIIAKVRGVNRLFLATAVLPTVISTVYFGIIASDVYISESRFVVRSPQRQTSTGLGAFLQGAGFSKAQDDTYTVHDYMLSRDALRVLDDKLSITKLYSNSSIDLFSRFGAHGVNASFEDLHKYYQEHVTINLDTSSSISTLKIRAFNAKDAHEINEQLLVLSEQLVNQLNERGRKDMIRFAQSEVESAEQKARSASLALSAYRNQKSVFDPEKQSALQLQQISKLQDELIATKMQLVQIRTATPSNPQISALEKRVATLQGDIEVETAKVVGGGASLSNKAGEYERLALDRTFADKQLAGALTSLEQARNEAQRKQLYLERIVQPSTPDVAMEPKRIKGIAATIILGMLAWGILSMLIAGIREHRD